MSATLPLPLELTQPVKLTSSLEDSVKEMFGVETSKYNPETQVREIAAGVTMLYNGNTQRQTSTHENVVDVQVDVQLDIP